MFSHVNDKLISEVNSQPFLTLPESNSWPLPHSPLFQILTHLVSRTHTCFLLTYCCFSATYAVAPHHPDFLTREGTRVQALDTSSFLSLLKLLESYCVRGGDKRHWYPTSKITWVVWTSTLNASLMYPTTFRVSSLQCQVSISASKLLISAHHSSRSCPHPSAVQSYPKSPLDTFLPLRPLPNVSFKVQCGEVNAKWQHIP